MHYRIFSKILLAIGLAPFFAHAIDSSKVSNQVSNNDQYIVVLKPLPQNSVMTAQGFSQMRSNFVSEQAQQVSNQLGVNVEQQFVHLINGFVVKADKQQVKQLAKQDNVAFIEPDKIVSTMPVLDNRVAATQKNADWGLARIVKRKLSDVDGSYDYQYDGSGVTAYVVDTGVNIDHNEFGNRASVYADTGNGYIKNPPQTDTFSWDCNGHGTHVAGTIGGQTYGVAKNVNIVGVKVLSCDGEGSDSQVIAGLEEVLTLQQESHSPSVVNMSLGGSASEALDQAVDKLVSAGIPVVVAAGNQTNAFFESFDACDLSPARDGNAITVGASDETDHRASYSYFGECLDIFAPGSDITSAWIGSNYATNTISGTSMASPHVAGVAALYLQENPQLNPQQLKDELKERSTISAINMNVPWWSFYKHRLVPVTLNSLLYALPN